MKNTDEMMADLIRMYTKCEWRIRHFLMRDAGNELTPYTTVEFGKYIDNEFRTLYILKNGEECYINSQIIIKDSFECFRFAYETPLEDLIKEIYDGLIEYLNKVENNE